VSGEKLCCAEYEQLVRFQDPALSRVAPMSTQVAPAIIDGEPKQSQLAIISGFA
jgi:hypothetical protein